MFGRLTEMIAANEGHARPELRLTWLMLRSILSYLYGQRCKRCRAFSCTAYTRIAYFTGLWRDDLMELQPSVFLCYLRSEVVNESGKTGTRKSPVRGVGNLDHISPLRYHIHDIEWMY
jgi:hypothetical protein